MTTILEDLRRGRCPAPLAPSIREVCLIGDPSRRYIHIDPGPGPRGREPAEARRAPAVDRRAVAG